MVNLSAEHLISQLYKEGPNVSLKEFPAWALEQLRQVIPFDGAIWGTGHISTQNFHTQTSVDVSDEIFCQLIKHLDKNPILDKLAQNKGQAIDMSSVVKDSDFYRSALYIECFKPFAIERILSSIHLDERSGIFTLLTLYRFNREHCFTEQEQSLQNRLLYHLLSSASHRQFNEITQNNHTNRQDNRSALCDEKGIYHSVTQKFLDILDANFTHTHTQRFPLEFQATEGNFTYKNLQFEVVPCGELYKISVRAKNQLDELTDRERQVAILVCQGKTFKEVAKTLELSPSTVSNHIYRIYLKLGINTRSELNELIKHCHE